MNKICMKIPLWCTTLSIEKYISIFPKIVPYNCKQLPKCTV